MKFYVVKFMLLISFIASSMSCVAEVKANTEENPKAKTEKKETIKVALLLDTSNSMDGLINQAKAQLWEIVNELSYAKCEGETPNLKIALYEYGNDRLTSKSGYIKQVSEFTGDLDEISEHLFSLTTSGGDEFCGEVIDTAVKKLEWGKNEGDLKMVFIAGNEPFTQGKINFKDAIVNAQERDIVVNTIFCGNTRQGIATGWKEGADLGEGDYMTINQNKKIVHVVTPYDDEIIILNKKLNKTYVYYGHKGVLKYKKQEVQDENASELNEEVAVKRAVTKSSKLYDNSSWDLVDATNNESIKYSSVDKSKLPQELEHKSDKELEVYVKAKSRERKKIQAEIQILNTKRRQFVLEKQKSTKGDELESALINAIKKQAEKKNYKW